MFGQKKKYKMNEFDYLNEVRSVNRNRVIIAHVNIYSLRKKFKIIFIIGKINPLLMTKITKIGNYFP